MTRANGLVNLAAPSRNDFAPALFHEGPINDIEMITSHRGQFFQTVRVVEHHMKKFWLKVWTHAAAKEAVKVAKGRICAPARGRDQHHGMIPFLRKRVEVDFPLPHRACCRQIAAPMRFASSTSAAS